MLPPSVRLNGSELNTTRWITYVPSAAWICFGALSAYLPAIISWTVLVLCRCKAVYLQYCFMNVWGSYHTKRSLLKLRGIVRDSAAPMGLLKQTKAVLQRTSRKHTDIGGEDTKGSWFSAISTTWSSTYPCSGCEHTHKNTHTWPIDFVIPIWESHNLLWPHWQKFPGIVLITGSCTAALFVPDLQHFGRSVDSNKGLLNNTFHSPTQEGPAWPRGVSCSFEHLNPHAASDFPLLFAGVCSFAVFPCALWLWKGASGLRTGSF